MNLSTLFQNSPVPAALFCDGVFSLPEGKSAQGVIRHSMLFNTVVVIDRHLAGSHTDRFIPNSSIPIVASLEEALVYDPQAFVISMTESDYGVWENDEFIRQPNEPGDLPCFWESQIIAALKGGLHVISCLNGSLLQRFDTVRIRANQHIVDLRTPSSIQHKFSGRNKRKRAQVIHIAGSDSVIGKRTTALQLYREAIRQGVIAGYIGTGQTCQLIGCDEGAVVDQSSGFYATGLIEKMIDNIDESFDVLFIKGQASVYHPAFGGLASSILYGSQPDAIIFVHNPDRTHRYHWEHLPIKDIKEEIRTLEEMTGAPVVGIATRGLENIDKLKSLVSIPVADPLLNDGTQVLLSAAWSQLGVEVETVD